MTCDATLSSALHRMTARVGVTVRVLHCTLLPRCFGLCAQTLHTLHSIHCMRCMLQGGGQ